MDQQCQDPHLQGLGGEVQESDTIDTCPACTELWNATSKPSGSNPMITAVSLIYY